MPVWGLLRCGAELGLALAGRLVYSHLRSCCLYVQLGYMAKSSTIVIRLTDEDRAWLEKGAKGRPVSEWARELLVREAKRAYMVTPGGNSDCEWIKRQDEATNGLGPQETLEIQLLGAMDRYLKSTGRDGL